MITHYQRPKKSKKLILVVFFLFILVVSLYFLMTKSPSKSSVIVISPKAQTENTEIQNPKYEELKSIKQQKERNKLPAIPLDKAMNSIL